MDYKAVSQQVVDNVGGLENIEGATHCVTRLRLVLKDTSKYNKAELENIDGVKGVLYNSGQLMIIFGTGTVNKVYDEFMALTGVKEISASEVKGAEADKKGKFFSVLKVFSDIFIPIIPAFVGAAIIIGLENCIKHAQRETEPQRATTGTWSRGARETRSFTKRRSSRIRRLPRRIWSTRLQTATWGRRLSIRCCRRSRWTRRPCL